MCHDFTDTCTYINANPGPRGSGVNISKIPLSHGITITYIAVYIAYVKVYKCFISI